VTIDGPTSLAFSENVRGRFEAQGWQVQEIDGEDVAGLDAALEAARDEEARPSLIVTRTTIGRGSPNWAGQSKAHGGPFGAEEARATKQNLGIPLEPEFLVPKPVQEYLAERAAAKRRDRQAEDARFARWRSTRAEQAAAWEAARERRLPEDLIAHLLEGMDTRADATRKHSGEVIQRIVARAPILVGGSADLAGSNNTTIKGASDVGPSASGEDAFEGSNVHYGVREHAMAAITNGMALDGTFVPFAGTFMVFSDYMRPSLRLAALMKVRSTFAFTHDSIFVGEDGPTHQPIEQLDALRAIPGLTLFRPADGVETAMAWAWVLLHAEGPTALALTRQGVPALEREAPFAPEDVWKGAYLLREGGPQPDVVLVATGSEVAVAAEAARKLDAEGLQVRVVSAPSLERFAAQGDDYRDALLPRGVPVVAVEAARGESFRGLTGRDGLVYGLDRFGLSAPWKDLAEHFGYVPDKLAEAVRRHLRG